MWGDSATWLICRITVSSVPGGSCKTLRLALRSAREQKNHRSKPQGDSFCASSQSVLPPGISCPKLGAVNSEPLAQATINAA